MPGMRDAAPVVRRRIMERQKTVPEIIEEIKTQICEDYCRYPRDWDEIEEGMELIDSDICTNCPLGRL
jgi:hypothetical protein